MPQDACVFFENHALILEPRVMRDAEAAARLDRGFGDKRVAIHGGHGISRPAKPSTRQLGGFVLMNRCCEAQLLAQACGKPSAWSTENARLASVLGSTQFGWLRIADARRALIERLLRVASCPSTYRSQRPEADLSRASRQQAAPATPSTTLLPLAAAAP